MEKEINIAKILKNVPIGTKLYSPLFGDVFLKYIGEIFITVRHHGTTANFYHNGRLYDYEGTEPMLFPSREMRDWSKLIEKAQPKVELKSLDMVLVKDYEDSEWYLDTFESMEPNCIYPYKCMMNLWKYCIPYKGNEHLLGTTKDAKD